MPEVSVYQAPWGGQEDTGDALAFSFTSIFSKFNFSTLGSLLLCAFNKFRGFNLSAQSMESIDLVCLYTKQKLKRKKIFQDGILRLFRGKEGYAPPRCTLYNSSNLQLEYKILTIKEYQELADSTISDLELDDYLVEIEQTIVVSEKFFSHENKAKRSRFIPPPRIINTQRLQIGPENIKDSGNISLEIMKCNSLNYSLSSDDLDNIWGVSNPKLLVVEKGGEVETKDYFKTTSLPISGITTQVHIKCDLTLKNQYVEMGTTLSYSSLKSNYLGCSLWSDPYASLWGE